jgi:hypothetical protein
VGWEKVERERERERSNLESEARVLLSSLYPGMTAGFFFLIV